eukprot:TRINITY_DN15940_c0_g1_i1.p1 TRINITY_DN15940_c0_g1~~TRINITY_DN15940_c0_g1_i1.p1  ORF type:complete len:164 (-),score=19.18 TRINITY_DN15940_c0_g1_i1:113-604(-)
MIYQSYYIARYLKQQKNAALTLSFIDTIETHQQGFLRLTSVENELMIFGEKKYWMKRLRVYTPPESRDSGRWVPESAIWGLGVLLRELEGIKWHVDKVKPRHLNKQEISLRDDFCQRALVEIVADRPSIDIMQQHPWIKRHQTPPMETLLCSSACPVSEAMLS